jgi:tRNA/rRNA methyltransferase
MPSTEGRPDAGNELATGEKVQALMLHWEQAITAVKFLDPAHPKKLVPRMRHMFARNNLTQDEVDMMRGLCTAMIKTARKADQER